MVIGVWSSRKFGLQPCRGLKRRGWPNFQGVSVGTWLSHTERPLGLLSKSCTLQGPGLPSRTELCHPICVCLVPVQSLGQGQAWCVFVEQ